MSSSIKSFVIDSVSLSVGDGCFVYKSHAIFGQLLSLASFTVELMHYICHGRRLVIGENQIELL